MAALTNLLRPAAFAAAGGLALVTLAHPSATRMQTWPWALVVTALWLLPVGLLATRLVVARGFHTPGKLISGALLVLAVSTVVAAWASPFRAASLALAWPTLGGVALLFLLHDWLAAPGDVGAARAASLARWIAGFSALVVLASLAGWAGRLDTALLGTRNAWPFGHSNYTAGFIVLALPWLLERAVAGRGFTRVAWALVAALALFALAGTSSRGAVLALAAVATAATVGALRFAPWSRGKKIILVTALVAVSAAAVAANPRIRDLVFRGTWSDAARESNRQRSAMLAAGLELGRERPLLGWGPGTVPLAYPQVRARLDAGVENVLQLHNTPVQLWATLGAAGALALGLLVLGFAATLPPALRETSARRISLAALASLGGYAVFALTDHQFDLPIMAAMAVANLALLTAAAARFGADNGTAAIESPPARRPLRIVALLGTAALIAGPLLALTRDLRARAAYDAALTAMAAGRNDEVLPALDRAIAAAPQDPFLQHQAASWLLRERENTADPARRTELAAAVVTRLEASLRTNAHAEFAHFNLGWLLLHLGRHADAARHFNAAARLVPDKGGVYLGLGLALLETGHTDDAVRALALEIINDPRQVTAPAWEVPLLASLWPRVHAEALRLYTDLRSAHPPAAQAEVWTRWWIGEEVDRATLKPAFTSSATAFVDTLPLIERGDPLLSGANWPWARLYQAWRQREIPPTFAALAEGDAAFSVALERRAAKYRGNFHAFLGAPAGEDDALTRTLRRERTGYGVLARHPGGPPLVDLYIVQENRVPTDFAAELFPPKGWLPGRFLLALLPPNPR